MEETAKCRGAKGAQQQLNGSRRLLKSLGFPGPLMLKGNVFIYTVLIKIRLVTVYFF